jgi:hypothetical protein
MHGCWKKLCPDLVQDFKRFEKTPEDATKVVHFMNELNLGVSIEHMAELIASYSELMSSEDLIDIQEENKTPPVTEGDDDCQSIPTKTLTVKEMKEAFGHLKQFLSISIMEQIMYLSRGLPVLQ